MRHAHFKICGEGPDRLILRDLGPWSLFPTVTNDVEWVVGQVAANLGERHLLYFDSEDTLDEIVVRDGKFECFRHWPKDGAQ